MRSETAAVSVLNNDILRRPISGPRNKSGVTVRGAAPSAGLILTSYLGEPQRGETRLRAEALAKARVSRGKHGPSL